MKFSSLNIDASFSDHLGGATRSKKSHILLLEALGKIEEAGLVVNGQDGYLLISKVINNWRMRFRTNLLRGHCEYVCDMVGLSSEKRL